MATKPDAAKVSARIKHELLVGERASRRMRSYSFWSMFGVERRTPASIARVAAALSAVGVSVRSPGDALGTEERDDWIFLSLAETEASMLSDRLEAPGKVPLTADPVAYTTSPLPVSDSIGEGDVRPNRAWIPAASEKPAPSPAPGSHQPRAEGLPERISSFARDRPLSALLIVFLILLRPMRFFVLGVIVWLWRLFRQGRLEAITSFARQNKAGVLVAGGLTTALVVSFAAIAGYPPSGSRSLPDDPQLGTTKQDRDTATSLPEATATEEATATTQAPTETQTATPLPPTSTPLPPTPRPPTAVPPVVSDGGQPAVAPPAPVQQFAAPPLVSGDQSCGADLVCSDWNDWYEMNAWWEACGRPKRFDKDNDGIPCEALQ